MHRSIIDDFADDTLRHHKGRGKPYDGIIGRVTPELATLAKSKKIPLVNVWFSSPVEDVPSVYSDNNRAGEMIAEHMLARGIRHFLCLVRRGDAAERLIAERVEQIVTQNGGTCQTVRVALLFAHTAAQWKKTRATIEKWLQAAPVPAGVIAGVDVMARYVAQICTELDYRVPEDIAIVGGGNEPSVCLYPEPTLTSIEFGLNHIGYESARMMHRLLKGEKLKKNKIVVPPKELVVRQSSDFVYVDEEIVSSAMQYIARHSRQRLGVDDVAQAVGTSRRTLETRFETRLGRSVGAEIRRVRLDQAKRLLASSDESIKQIARLTGIGTAQQFARVFRREIGMSPREYRGQFVEK